MSDEPVDRGHHSVLKSAAATAAEAMIPVDDVHKVDHSRRRLLTAATAGIGAVGVVFAAVPFIASWEPSVRARYPTSRRTRTSVGKLRRNDGRRPETGLAEAIAERTL